jgi:hypothetical protein
LIESKEELERKKKEEEKQRRVEIKKKRESLQMKNWPIQQAGLSHSIQSHHIISSHLISYHIIVAFHCQCHCYLHHLFEVNMHQTDKIKIKIKIDWCIDWLFTYFRFECSIISLDSAALSTAHPQIIEYLHSWRPQRG